MRYDFLILKELLWKHVVPWSHGQFAPHGTTLIHLNNQARDSVNGYYASLCPVCQPPTTITPSSPRPRPVMLKILDEQAAAVIMEQQRSSHHVSSPALPPDWIEVTDPASGNPYYANLATGETSWDPPPALPSSYEDRLPPATTTASITAATTVPISQQQQQPQQHVPTLVQTVRTMIEAEQYYQRSVHSMMELDGLSAGQIADLCVLQQEQHQQDEELKPYTPIHPYKLEERARRQPMESARLEVRMHTLYEQLRKLR